MCPQDAVVSDAAKTLIASQQKSEGRGIYAPRLHALKCGQLKSRITLPAATSLAHTLHALQWHNMSGKI